jgi:hypothetical protein
MLAATMTRARSFMRAPQRSHLSPSIPSERLSKAAHRQ